MGDAWQRGVPQSRDAPQRLRREVRTSYGVHLVEERDHAVLLSEVADLLNRSDGAAHRVDTLERDDLRRLLGELGEFLL